MLNAKNNQKAAEVRAILDDLNKEMDNKNKDIILSTSLFNGQGFIHMHGFSNPDPNTITINDKDKDENYVVIQNKAIRLTKDNFNRYGKFNE